VEGRQRALDRPSGPISSPPGAPRGTSCVQLEDHAQLRHLLIHYRTEGNTRGKGADWVKKTLGWSVDLVERPKKPAPEEVLRAWAREWNSKRAWP
jgi:hypothetical protein